VISGKSVLAIITARGGSKRFPRKNVLPMAGKPLIVWAIEAGQQSKCVDRLVVSSEDREIIDISRRAGAEIVKRPKELATDEASSVAAIEHAVNEIDDEYDFTILLQPTSPLRNEKHIDGAFELLSQKNADAVVSVFKTDHNSPINNVFSLGSNTLPDDGSMVHFLREETKNASSQDLPGLYRVNGSIYICKTNRLIKEKTLFINDNIFAYLMKPEHSIDIDNELDFRQAELLLINSLQLLKK